MTTTPLFDCVTHPTPTGAWLREHDGAGNTREALLAEMEQADVRWAFAIGMGLGGYDEATYAAWVREAGASLFPVAFYDFAKTPTPDEVPAYLTRLKETGYVGVKVHPRQSAITYRDERLPTLITAARETGLVVLLCTYVWERSERFAENTVEDLARLLAHSTDEGVMLVHGGGVRLLDHVELARAFPHVLLDLSLTLCKYEGSSIDQDLAFCFSRFDRRICVGSDAPEIQLTQLRRRFEQFAEGLAPEKRVNVAHANVLRFLGRDDLLPAG